MRSTAVKASPRDRVLAVASELFYADGIRAVGVERVIEEAGVAKATLYFHFKSKDDLVAAYLRDRSDAWRSHVTRELARRGRTAEESILAVFDLLEEYCSDSCYRGCPFINAAAEYPGHATIAEVTSAHRDWIRELFTDLASDAGFSRSRRLGRALSQLYDGMMVAAQLDGDAASGNVTREAVRGLLRGWQRRS